MLHGNGEVIRLVSHTGFQHAWSCCHNFVAKFLLHAHMLEVELMN